MCGCTEGKAKDVGAQGKVEGGGGFWMGRGRAVSEAGSGFVGRIFGQINAAEL